MRVKSRMLFGLAVGFGLMTATSALAVEIEYWQYTFEGRVKAIDALIEQFQKANPDITVKHVDFPYADYPTKVAASITAGQGPDVVQLYYGWVDGWLAGNLIQPLPKDAFPHDQIEKNFFSIVKAMKRGDDYYGLPTAVRSLALFYNKKMFADAGLDPNKPPATLDELVDAALKTTKRDASGNLEQEGFGVDMTGQDHHWIREVLIRQFGGAPYSDDYKSVTYDSAAGDAAIQWYVDLQQKHKVGEAGFMDTAQAAFQAGRAAMEIDGTFRLSAFGKITDFEWGVTELPSKDGNQGNYASYWANAIASTTSGDELKAAEKFLAFVTTPDAMKLWLEYAGELPANPAIALTSENQADPKYGPFLKGLAYAHTTLFVEELAQRQTQIDMVNHVLLEGQSVADAVATAAKAEQEVLDKYYKK
ncbi:MAG: extracellular solute-binding protein [Bauldia sp.]